MCGGRTILLQKIQENQGPFNLQLTLSAATHLTVVFDSAKIFGNAFVAYKVSDEASIPSRPNSDGTMTSVTTLKL